MGTTFPEGWKRLHAALPPELHRRARATASLDGQDLKDLIVVAIREYVERREAERRRKDR